MVRAVRTFLALTVAVLLAACAGYLAARQGALRREADARAAARLETQAALLRSAAALLSARPATSASEFSRFVAHLPLREAGLSSLGFLRSFHRGETAQVEGELRALGAPGRVFPDLGREERSAVLLLEPPRPGQVGLDLFTDPAYREALERSRATHAPARAQVRTGSFLCLPVAGGAGWTFGELDY